MNQNKLLRMLINSSKLGCSYVLPLWEKLGSTANDVYLGGTVRDASYVGNPTLGVPTANPRIPFMCQFVDGSYVAPNAAHSLANGYRIGFLVALDVVSTGTKQQIIFESTEADATEDRFSLYLDETNHLVLQMRNVAGQTITTVTSTDAISAGIHILHVLVSLPTTKSVTFYLDGAVLTSTGTLNFTTAAIGAAAYPLAHRFGRYTDAEPRRYLGGLGFVVKYTIILTPKIILNQAKAGGVA